MSEQMASRGPDGHGLWLSVGQRVGLAHRRLAVVDPTEQSRQPLVSLDGNFVIVFNGEIYNYREIRADLERTGSVFRGRSDTEVLVALYAREGVEMCHRLRGMFAFAIWDQPARSLFLARDAFGIKPLYLYDSDGVVRFASQVKALLAGAESFPKISTQGLHGFQLWGSVPEPFTAFENITALEPGTWRMFRSNAPVESGKFDSVDSMLSGVEHSPFANLREALQDSVRAHLVADVPVGVFLSAGIDSGALASVAAESLRNTGHRLRTVTLGFKEFRNTATDETGPAEDLARHLGTEHQTVWLSREDFAQIADRFFETMDQPSIDGLNTWLVSRAASQAGLKVAISGLGGDELFGGYPSFRQLPLIRRLVRPFGRCPVFSAATRRASLPVLKKLMNPKYAGLLEYGHHWGGAYLLRRALQMPWDLPTGSASELPSVPDSLSGTNHKDRVAVGFLETACYMRNQLLRDADWAGMANSVEIRVPLVDAPLLRFVARQRELGVILDKRDLANCAAPALPRSIVRRRKTGFTVPIRHWIGVSTERARGLRGWQAIVLGRYLDSCAKYTCAP